MDLLLSEIFERSLPALDTTETLLAIDSDSARKKCESARRWRSPHRVARLFRGPFNPEYVCLSHATLRNGELFPWNPFSYPTDPSLIIDAGTAGALNPFVAEHLVAATEDWRPRVFPRYRAAGSSAAGEHVSNIGLHARNLYGVGGTDDLIFRHVVAVTHSEQYTGGRTPAQISIPMPDDLSLLRSSAHLGAELIAIMRASLPVATQIFWPEVREVAAFQYRDKRGVRGTPKDRTVEFVDAQSRTYTGVEHDRLCGNRIDASEKILSEIGASAFDVRINSDSFWSNIPAKVWEYASGKVPVLASWLEARSVERIGRPLSSVEIVTFSELARRITIRLLLHRAIELNLRDVTEERDLSSIQDTASSNNIAFGRLWFDSAS